MMRKLGNAGKIFFFLGILFLIPFVVCTPQEKVLKKVRFLPLWVPQPQFAGYYMAVEKGIYKKYGLDVSITPGGYSQNVTESLKSGDVDFGILFLYTGVMERSKGTKIVNIGQIFQHSSIMFVARKKSGIKTLKDFNGKRIGVWRSTVPELTAGFIKKHNINAEIVPFDKGISIFLKGAVDITVMMNYNEYKYLINSGVNPDEISKFSFYDYGMNFPEDGIYCMEDTYNRDPEMCRKFVQASVEGWNYALAHRDETLDAIKKYQKISKVASNRSHNSWMLNSMQDLISSSGKNVKKGCLLENDYNNLIDFLNKGNLITNAPGFTDFYKGLK